MKQHVISFLKRIWKDIRTYGIALAAYILYYEVTLHLLGATCPSLLFWGIPCPGCGMTRAISFLFTFEWERSFNLHPLATPWLIFIILGFIYRYIIGKIPQWLKGTAICLLVLTIGFFVIRMILYFPDQIPYVYREKNLVSNILPTYGQSIHHLFFH